MSAAEVMYVFKFFGLTYGDTQFTCEKHFTNCIKYFENLSRLDPDLETFIRLLLQNRFLTRKQHANR